MIDLRSDTVTLPSEGMRRAMAAAEVGDDVYGDDPTVNALEDRTAELLGKEAAVFVPTGSMSNQIAVRTQTEPGDLVLIHRRAHIVLNEGGAGAAISGVTMRLLESDDGTFSAEDVVEALGRPHPFNPTTLSSPPRLLCLENTHNAGGGTVWPVERLGSVCAVGREHGLRLHLDGARLWHAAAASGVSERTFAGPFDTVNVCFSKGLGAPVGSALAGSRAMIDRARRFRQQLGGGWRQAGILAAAALYALEHHRSELRHDVDRARAFAERLADLDGVSLEPARVDSNIVRFRIDTDAGELATRCHEHGLQLLPNGVHGVRAVLHRDITDADVKKALDILGAVLEERRAGRSI